MLAGNQARECAGEKKGMIGRGFVKLWLVRSAMSWELLGSGLYSASDLQGRRREECLSR